MAELAGTNPTLADWRAQLDPDGSIAVIAEILEQQNQILEDQVWIPGNKPDGHKITVRTGYPTPTWRKLNQGVPDTKGTQEQITEAIGMLEDFSQVDKDLADLNGNTAAFRFNESKAHIIGMSHTYAETLFYGDTDINPERFMGLAPRFSDLSAGNAANIIDAGGTGADNTSIWLVGWDEETVCGTFKKNGQAGLTHEDLGLETVTDASGNKFRAYQDHYKWDSGLAVKDWRFIVRIANIDVSNLTPDATGSSADLVKLMADAAEQIQDITPNTAFYMPRSVRTVLRHQSRNAKNVNLTFDMAGGKRIMSFDEIPVRRTDAIKINEAQVT